MSKESKKLCNCNMGCSPSLQERGLCPLTSTSILCNRELLKNNTRLEFICSNGENEYYHVKGTRAVIMHVEEDFCILMDYGAKIHMDEPEGNEETVITVDLPQELCKYKYTMQRMGGRDCVVGNNNRRISYDIIEIFLGKEEIDFLKSNELIIGYRKETYDESFANFTKEREEVNIDKSHHVRVKITSMEILNLFIDDIFVAETRFDRDFDGVYYDIVKNCRDKRGRDFVEWDKY